MPSDPCSSMSQIGSSRPWMLWQHPVVEAHTYLLTTSAPGWYHSLSCLSFHMYISACPTHAYQL
jgi:hypothetical protein